MSPLSSSRIVLFLNGEIADLSKVSAQLRPDDILICADGGSRHVAALGRTPSAVIGDFDSTTESERARLEAQGVELVRHPREKDSTDFELALEYIAEHVQENELLLVGAFGGRIDHMFTNLLGVFKPHLSQFTISFFDGLTWAFPVTGPAELIVSKEAGAVLSLLPVSTTVTGVHLLGTKWELSDHRLQMGSGLSLSNEIQKDDAKLHITEGQVMVIQQGISSQD